jgi:hypothetical protein
MWMAVFTLNDHSPAGEITNTQTIAESGFANKGQVEHWLATGARARYGPEFWHRCSSVEVKENRCT